MLLRKKRGKISANMKMSIGQSDAPVRGFKPLLARYPLVFYFIITYAFAWLAEIPLVLSKDGVGLLSYGSSL